MNRKPNDQWTLKLGLSQVVILLGVTTGCLALSFYLGFFSGKRVGFSEAMDTNLALVPKIPITSESTSFEKIDSAEQVVSDVYANLKNQGRPANSATSIAEIAMPEIKPIEKTKQQEQKDLSDVFGDDDLIPLPSIVAPTDQNKPAAGDPWISTTQDNQNIPPVIGDGAKDSQSAKSPIDQAIDKALDKVVPTVAPTAVPTVAVIPTKIPTLAPTVAPTAIPTKAPTKESGASIVRGTITKGWYAQVAAPTSKAESDALAKKLRDNGFRVAIESAQVRGESYYRILVGPEENRAQADALVRQLSSEKYLSGSPFIRMVK